MISMCIVESSVPTKVVMKLMDPLLNKGRTLCTDNYYTHYEEIGSSIRKMLFQKS